MKKKGLTDLQVKHMQPDPERRLEIPVGPAGLYLVVQTSGAKSWALRYRWRGRTRKATFPQPYPEMTLLQARAEAEAKLKGLRDDDIDPAAAVAAEVAEEKPNTLAVIIEEWFARHIRKNCDWPEAERLMKVNVLPVWRDKYIHEIGKPDVLRLLDGVVDRGSPVAANRLLSVIRPFFNWAIGRGYINVSPVAGIKPPTIEQSRDRVLVPEELADVWQAAGTMGYPTGQYIRFLMLTAQRKGEVATMKWADTDIKNGMMWTLPAEAPKQVNKAGRIHDVPLSPAAVEILESLPHFKYTNEAGKEVDGEYIWTTTAGRKAINGFSKMKTRLDDKVAALRKARGVEKDIADWTLHDLRRSAATHMAKAGVPPHVLGAILNHQPGSTQGVTSIYNRFRYTDERRAALDAWAQYVVSLEQKTKRATA